MIGLGAVYLLAGFVFGAIAVLSAFDRANPKRWVNALFWGLFAVSFLFGDRFGDLGNGVLVLVMAALAGFIGLGLGWAALLPQMLAALGAVFALAGLGTAVGDLAAQAIPADNRFAAVAAYTIGMAVFTAIM